MKKIVNFFNLKNEESIRKKMEESQQNQ